MNKKKNTSLVSRFLWSVNLWNAKNEVLRTYGWTDWRKDCQANHNAPSHSLKLGGGHKILGRTHTVVCSASFICKVTVISSNITCSISTMIYAFRRFLLLNYLNWKEIKIQRTMRQMPLGRKSDFEVKLIEAALIYGEAYVTHFIKPQKSDWNVNQRGILNINSTFIHLWIINIANFKYFAFPFSSHKKACTQ